MIFYLSPGSPETLSGGTRKLYDHVGILTAAGFQATIIYNHQAPRIDYQPDDLIVIPEVYGDGIRDFVPNTVRKIAFVQNGYLVDRFGVQDRDRHAFLTTPELVGIFTESAHTETLLRARFPDLQVPLIRTHSSGNGRNGGPGPFHYGEWPRDRAVVYFGYKHEQANALLFHDLDLPDGWVLETLTGQTDEAIAQRYRTAAIFAAANTEEGMCAPTSEAIISGCVNVCWPGGPTGQTIIGGPMEYLQGRSVVAAQDNIEALRSKIVSTARKIDLYPQEWATKTRAWSDWFQETYSRQAEIDETIAIFEKLGCKAALPFGALYGPGDDLA